MSARIGSRTIATGRGTASGHWLSIASDAGGMGRAALAADAVFVSVQAAEVRGGLAAGHRNTLRDGDREALHDRAYWAIVISGDVVFGDDCVIRQGVTVGLRNRNQRGSPRVGNRVDIGAGAKLLGDIVIGDDVAIGANAVVLCDVPAGRSRWGAGGG